MFNFKGFLTMDKNTHLEHLEDDIINRGSTGGENSTMTYSYRNFNQLVVRSASGFYESSDYLN